jgi:hypothetical protein
LRRFLMTEPIRPPSLRHNGRGHAIAHRRPGDWAHARDFLNGVSATRSRSALAYPVPQAVVTEPLRVPRAWRAPRAPGSC